MNTITKSEARKFIHQYLATALWSSHDFRSDRDEVCYDPEAGENMDDSFQPEDAHPDTLKEARTDLFEFLRQCNWHGIDLREVNPDLSQHAHDLWLTRCGHGAGFWDRGYGRGVGKALTAIAVGMGNRECMAVDNHTYCIE